jgi:hypothetical protein
MLSLLGISKHTRSSTLAMLYTHRTLVFTAFNANIFQQIGNMLEVSLKYSHNCHYPDIRGISLGLTIETNSLPSFVKFSLSNSSTMLA